MQKKMLVFLSLTLASSALAEPLTVEFWHIFGDAKRKGWIEQKAAEFNAKNPDIKVTAVVKGNYNENLQAAILAGRQGKPPALVQIFEVGSQLALDSGVFQPVGSVEKTDYSDYLKPVVDYYTIGGKVNSLPFNSSSPVLYANRDLLKKVGLSETALPQTYNALMRTCAKVKTALPDIKCITFSASSWYFEQWMAEQGTTLVNNNNGRTARATESNLDSPAARNIFTFIKKLNDGGYYTYTGKLDDGAGSGAIFTGQKSVFLINSTADLGNQLDAAKQGGYRLGVGLLPIQDGSARNGVVIGGASLWIAKGIPDNVADAARSFALFMTNTANMKEWHKLTGYYPVRTSSVNELRKEGWLDSAAPQTVAFRQLLNTKAGPATAGALFGGMLPTRQVIQEGIQKVLQGQDVDSVAKDTKARVDKVIADYNKSLAQ